MPTEEQREKKRAYMANWNAANKEKLREYQRRYREADPERKRAQNRAAYARNRDAINAKKRDGYYKGHEPAARRAAKLLRKYGLTSEAWWSLLESQGFRCAICGATKPGGNGWQTDHCHDSGAVRGILCVMCNTGIGKLKDDPQLLRVAARYLEVSSVNNGAGGKGPLPQTQCVVHSQGNMSHD